MSDPARDNFECHGPMAHVTLGYLTAGAMDTPGVAAYLCKTCGVWRHGLPRIETQLRAIVEARMETLSRGTSH